MNLIHRRLGWSASALVLWASLLVVLAPTAHAAPAGFLAPFTCNSVWSAGTYSGHGNAIDFAQYSGSSNVSQGKPVLASEAGKVVYRGYDSVGGNLVRIGHSSGWETYYGHLNTISVAQGATVKKGQQLGTAGRTGLVIPSTFSHLHYEQRLNGAAQKITFAGKVITARWGGVVGGANTVKSTNCPSTATPGKLSVSSGLKLTPSVGWLPSTSIASTFTVKNIGGTSMTLSRLSLAVRDPKGGNRDSVCGDNITLKPGATKVCSMTKTYPLEGKYTAWLDWRSGTSTWHPGQLGGNTSFTLKYGTITNTRLPSVNGPGTVGSTLAVTPGAWSVSGLTVKGQWLRDGVAVAGQTGTSYTLLPGDAAHQIRYRESVSRAGYKSTSATSGAIGVAQPAVTLVRPPALPSEVRVGEVVRPTPGAWSPTVTPLWSRWLINGSTIPGITAGETYVPKPGDVGRRLTYAERVTLAGHLSNEAASNSVLVKHGILRARGNPSVKGARRVGRTLRATTGTWNVPVGVSTRWSWRSSSGAKWRVVKHGTALRLKKRHRGGQVRADFTVRAPGYGTVHRSKRVGRVR